MVARPRLLVGALLDAVISVDEGDEGTAAADAEIILGAQGEVGIAEAVRADARDVDLADELRREVIAIADIEDAEAGRLALVLDARVAAEGRQLGAIALRHRQAGGHRHQCAYQQCKLSHHIHLLERVDRGLSRS